MPNLIHWTQTILEGSKMVLFFKIFKKMKINQKFAKRAVVVASMTAGIIGLNSMFNEAQATNSGCVYNYMYKCCMTWGGGSGCMVCG